jgi:hypothetical protein
VKDEPARDTGNAGGRGSYDGGKARAQVGFKLIYPRWARSRWASVERRAGL